MTTCKITVLKTMFNKDLSDEYRPPELHQGPCRYYSEGQEFTVRFNERPRDWFCEWAWNDIHKALMVLMMGGDFSGWMQDGNTSITCCTDGIKPVVFKLERIDERRT